MKTEVMIVLDTNAVVTKSLAFQQYVERAAGKFAIVLENGVQYAVLKEEKVKGVSLDDIRSIAGEVGRALQAQSADAATIGAALFANDEEVTAFVEGWHLGQYAFDKYVSEKANPVVPLTVEGGNEDAVKLGEVRAQSMSLSRDLMNELSNVLNPETFPEVLKEHFAGTKVDVTVLSKEEIEERQMNGVLTVGRGSKYEPRFVELTYRANDEKPLVALVGKGVTFDTGGISLKSGADLSDMRMDMGGAAAVTGALNLLAQTEADVNVVGLIPMVENAPDNTSVYPGEIIEYKNGVTVQVGNTDAEGRLILADGLIRADELEADYIVDIATLTGAIHNALGDKIGGVFAGDEELAVQMKRLGEENGDFVWPMPLVDAYDAGLKSDYADLLNISTLGFGGSITAALFLRNFVKNPSTWAHVDMAGTMEASKAEGYYAKSATGYGARLLADYAVSVSK